MYGFSGNVSSFDPALLCAAAKHIFQVSAERQGDMLFCVLVSVMAAFEAVEYVLCACFSHCSF